MRMTNFLVFLLLLLPPNTFGFFFKAEPGEDFDDGKSFLQKNDTKLQQVQVKAIEAYTRRQKNVKWECDYQDHVTSFESIPVISTAEVEYIFGTAMMENDGENVIGGAHNIAAKLDNVDFEYLVIWEGVYVNSFTYYDVLYGGYKYLHGGIGNKAPSSFFSNNTEVLEYYDLTACMPFTTWIRKYVGKSIMHFVRLPQDEQTTWRNKFHGIAALLLPKSSAEVASATYSEGLLLNGTVASAILKYLQVE